MGRARPLLVAVLAVGTALRIWYAAWGLNEKRFWDERYNFENVASILDTGSLRPAKVYYPSPLVSWPQARALAASEALQGATGSPLFAARDASGFTPLAYLICRLFSVAYGVASLWVLFLLGRTILSERIALLAVLAMTFLPWHVHVSGKFKPDALVVLTVLAAFYGCVRAIRRPGLGRAVVAGLGIALALSSKLTGGVVAVPFALGSVLAGGRDWMRRLGFLAIAGVVSLLAFLALNPYGRWYLSFLSGLQRDYAMRADMHQAGEGSIPIQVVSYLLGDYVHGPFVGVLALGAAVLLALRVVRGGDAPVERACLAMLLVFPVAFTAAYTAATSYFKGNNFLPMVPFTAIMAAWLGLEGWQRLGVRFSLLASAPVRRVALSAVTVALALPGFLYAYRSLVPSTLDLARQAAIGSRTPAARFFYLERGRESEPAWEGRDEVLRLYAGFRAVERLSELGGGRLDLADVEIFEASRLDGTEGEFYRDRVAGVGAEGVLRHGARLFRARGPETLTLVHPLTPVSAPAVAFAGRCTPGRNCFRFEGANEVNDGLVSIEIAIPTAAIDPERHRLAVAIGDRAVDTVRIGFRGLYRVFLTERFYLAGDDDAAFELRLTDLEPRLLRRDVDIRFHGWSRP